MLNCVSFAVLNILIKISDNTNQHVITSGVGMGRYPVKSSSSPTIVKYSYQDSFKVEMKYVSSKSFLPITLSYRIAITNLL